MNTVEQFSGKVRGYVTYRWDYSQDAVNRLIAACDLTMQSVIADIGAGTGMLARKFAGQVGTIFAIEPNAGMREIAAKEVGDRLRIIDAVSDQTTLSPSSIDMITVGRALHWFPPETTRSEFLRILKPDGWLAIFSVPCKLPALVADVRRIRTAENGWGIEAEDLRSRRKPLDYFFGHNDFASISIQVTIEEAWDKFLGRIMSMAPAPAPGHPAYSRLERALREIFDRYAVNETLRLPVATEVSYARIRRMDS